MNRLSIAIGFLGTLNLMLILLQSFLTLTTFWFQTHATLFPQISLSTRTLKRPCERSGKIRKTRQSDSPGWLPLLSCDTMELQHWFTHPIRQDTCHVLIDGVSLCSNNVSPLTVTKPFNPKLHSLYVQRLFDFNGTERLKKYSVTINSQSLDAILKT